ncbi:allantoinase AllB [Trebonia kvetii]|uniref:allantoinase n=1 Tax=Trebonia kvetii TaxID=2480626 RepID=A0A6P2BLV1_9ACTN|nr:allantoinase AllB [Trebonia kvetii]TVY99907.1 allantoinase AllB [Trebonia kvetii]
MSETLLIRSRRMVLPGGVTEAAVFVRDGRIEEVGDYDLQREADRTVDLGDLPLLPGLVDSHVHVNEPGRTEWEGFASATRAALAGGVTTICDMPLNSSPATTTVDALRAKVAAADGQCAVDVAFWGGAVPGNAESIGPMLDAGVVGFKCFLIDSGLPEFPPLSRAELRAAMKALAASGAPMIVHAEDPAEVRPPAGSSYGEFVASRPPVAERRAIETVISAAAFSGARAHIVHLAAGECAALISSAKAAGIDLSAETCPHYLFFAAEEVQPGHTEFKCCPPVRYAVNREALWRALGDGAIDGVVSDHSPCTPALKGLPDGDFRTAWGGISSLQLGLSVIWTVARRRGFTLADVARWMAAFPASLAGLPTKGRIAVGCDADLVAFDPDVSWDVRGAELLHRHPVTPYEGRTLTGRVSRVWLGGVEVTPADPPRGRLLARGGEPLEH